MTKKNTSNQEVNLVKNWLALKDPKGIGTHIDVDADAVFSAALLQTLRPSVSVSFLRADDKMESEGIIIVDMMNGKNAVKGLEQGSAFGVIVTAIKKSHPLMHKIMKPWAKQLNFTDQAKHCKDSVILADLVNAWKSCELDDEEILVRAVELVSGKWKTAQRRKQQSELASNIQIENGIAVLSKNDHVQSKDLFHRNALAVVRENENGLAIVLSRKAQESGLNLSSLKNDSMFDNDWFFHPNGWLASYGGRKAPKDPKKSNITLSILAERTKTLLAEVIS
jgi:hypothetical protein